jgi:hypothetical protein
MRHKEKTEPKKEKLPSPGGSIAAFLIYIQNQINSSGHE